MKSLKLLFFFSNLLDHFILFFLYLEWENFLIAQEYFIFVRLIL